MSYLSWKLAQLRATAAAEGHEPSAEEVLCHDWKEQRAVGPTILKVMMKSKSPKMCRVGVTLRVADNENKNVVFPKTEIKENLFSNDLKQAFVFLKIDPSKATFGDISMDVVVKPGKTSQIGTMGYGTSTGYSTTGGYSTSSGYYGVGSSKSYGVGTSTSTSYQPMGYDSTAKVICVNCDGECFVGEDYCGKCGKCPTEYDTV